MNCERIQNRLDDYVGGYLEEAETQAVERHLEICTACRDSFDELQSLLLQAKRLSSGIAPERDLWPGILERVERPEVRYPATANQRWMALAAVLALAVLAIPLLLRQRDPEPAQPVSAAVESESLDDAMLAKAELARSEDRVLLTRRDLVEAIELRRDLLGPETSKSVEDSLRVLDQAVAEIRLALEENPGNRRLRLLLAAKYQHEVRLLQRVSRV